LTDDELVQRREEYSDIGVKLAQIATDKKDAMDRFSAMSKEPKARASQLVESIKFKSEQIHGELFMIDDQDEKMMYFFDSTGMCVDERPLLKEERQLKLKTS
jgi:hypothetical protein